MKKPVLFPVLLAVCSAISSVIFRSPFAYLNLALSVCLLCIVIFSKSEAAVSRIRFSALWLLILELAAFVLLIFGVNLYQPSLVWLMYAVFMIIEIFVTPRMARQR